jgi:hypothetical protein
MFSIYTSLGDLYLSDYFILLLIQYFFFLELDYSSCSITFLPIKQNIRNNRNNVIILSEHVVDFHPGSQSPFGQCPRTLSQLERFKQWHLFWQSSPKVPWSQAVSGKHIDHVICYLSARHISVPCLPATSQLGTYQCHVYLLPLS